MHWTIWMRSAVLAASLWLAPATLTAQAAPATPDGTSALNAGDVVRITVWRKPEMSGEFVIAADGSVAHPLYREVRVTGLTMQAIETRLRTFLERFEANPQFVIEPLVRVAVGGEVRQPNLYSLRPETSITQAIALAGGPTELGRRDRVRLVRESREIVVDLRRPGAEWARTPVRSGDQILVERRRAIFRDYVAPTISVLGGLAAVVSVIIYNRNN